MRAMSDELPAAIRAAREARNLHRVTYDGLDSSVVRVPPEAVTRLVQRLAGAVSSSIRQIVPSPGEADSSEGFLNMVLRAIADDARRDVSVDRLYVVPPGGAALLKTEPSHSPRFTTHSVAIHESPRHFSEYPTTAAWLIDDAVVVRQGTTENPSWTVSSRSTDVQQFGETWRRLMDQVNQASQHESGIDLVGSLVRSADMVANAAPMMCDQRLFGEDTCDWYHGVWQYLRLFDLVCAPNWHHTFYSEELRRLLAEVTAARPDDPARILITGASDHSMLAYVGRAIEDTSVDASVAMLDLCRTPLLVSHWYAKNREPRLELDTHQLDVRRAPRELGSRVADLIVSDDLLNSLADDDDCRQVLEAWYDMLAPAGVVLTTVRIYPEAGPLGRWLMNAAEFTLHARVRAGRWQPCLSRRLDDVTAMVRRYATATWSRDLGDRTTVENLFRSAGFDVEYAKLDDQPGGVGSARYLSVVARKPRGD